MEEDMPLHQEPYLHILNGNLQPTTPLCPNQFQCPNVCVEPKCSAQTAFFCQQDNCKSCQPHLKCKSLKVSRLTQMIIDKTKTSRSFMLEILKKEEELISKLKQQSKNTIQWFLWNDFPGHCQPFIDSLYRKKENVNVKSEVISDLVSSFRENLKRLPNIEQLSNNLEKQASKLTEKMKEIQEKLLSKFFIKQKAEEKKEKIEEKKSEIEKPSKTLKILEKEDQSVLSGSKILNGQKEAIDFICNCLNEPSKMTLIYRGTLHGFDSKDFHRCCDEKADTFTLIKTSNSKTVGGYTPLKWTSVEGTYGDTSKRSFLISVDNLEKMELVVPQRAIFCNKSDGPCFGGILSGQGALDLCIYSNCDRSNANFSKFPGSYNHPVKKYQCNSHAWANFAGTERMFDDSYRDLENHFKVLEIEVYQVVW